MVIPAAEPTKQRFTAGSCILDVVVQPSALSQWSDRLVTDSVMFKLWLANSTDADTHADVSQSSQQLVAQGDRTSLQSVTQYIQTRTRQLLAVSTLGRPSNNQSSNQQSSSRQSSNQQSSHIETIAYPPEFEYSQPLSYLQLCDLNTVLSQYEQAVLTVPSVPAEQLSENIILLPTVRDRRAEPTANIVRLPRRSQKRVGLWASAAAAALAAVGLTTALWSRESTLQELTEANEAVISARVSEPETVQLEQALEDNTDSLTSASSDTSLSTDETLPAGSLPSGSVPTTAPDLSLDQAAQPLPRTPTESTRNLVVQPNQATTSDSGSTQALPAGTTANAPATEQNSTSERAERLSVASQSAIANSSTESLPTDADQIMGRLRTNALETDELETSNLEIDEVAPETETFTTENDTFSRSDTSHTDTSRIDTSRSDIDNNIRSAETAAPNLAANTAPPAESIQRPTSTAGQVQTYFQQRWQGGDNVLLLYELRLSPTGEVVSFTAINDAAEQQRDRIFPSTARPSFSNNTGGSSLTLRVVLNGDGTVQVLEDR